MAAAGYLLWGSTVLDLWTMGGRGDDPLGPRWCSPVLGVSYSLLRSLHSLAVVLQASLRHSSKELCRHGRNIHRTSWLHSRWRRCKCDTCTDRCHAVNAERAYVNMACARKHLVSQQTKDFNRSAQRCTYPSRCQFCDCTSRSAHMAGLLAAFKLGIFNMKF